MTSEAANILAKALEADASAHERGEYNSIGSHFDDVLQQVIPLNDVPEQVLGMAFDFWDCWLDSKNHRWMHHEPISKEDWPRVARFIADCVRTSSLPIHPTIRRLFVPCLKSQPDPFQGNS